MFEIVDNNDDDNNDPEHGYTICSPCEPDGTGELKTYSVFKDFCPHKRFELPPSYAV